MKTVLAWRMTAVLALASVSGLALPRGNTAPCGDPGQAAEIVARLWLAQVRFADLIRERKSIDEEREFYRGKPPPTALAGRLDATWLTRA